MAEIEKLQRTLKKLIDLFFAHFVWGKQFLQVEVRGPFLFCAFESSKGPFVGPISFRNEGDNRKACNGHASPGHQSWAICDR